MVTYQARELLFLQKEQLWALPLGPCIVVFDDGELQTTTQRTIFSVYCQEFHRLFPDTPLLKDRHHIGSERLETGTHLKLVGNSFWDAYDSETAQGRHFNIEQLCRRIYEITNEIYNDFTYRLEAHVSSINLLDFLDVINQKDIKEANDSVKPYEASITKTYGVIEDTLKDPKQLVGNPIAEAVKSNLLSLGQVLQCVGPRGTLTDIDSTIFPHPILTGYVKGMKGLYESMIESRSASKALLFTKDPLSDTEYFNREMQLLTATFKSVHGTYSSNYVSPSVRDKLKSISDCGSKKYRTVHLTASEFPQYVGKYHVSKDGSLLPIRKQDRHLIGKKVKIRSVFDCQVPDREGVCQTCFGELSLSIPAQTNIGHLCASTLCEKVSQAVLSTKHLETSSNVDELQLDCFAEQYIRIGNDPNTIGISHRLAKSNIKLVIASDEVPNISDVRYVNDVEQLTLSQVSEIRNITLIVEDKKGNKDTVSLPVSIGSRFSSFNHRMLKYLKTHGWNLTDSGDYVIDLCDWNPDHVIFELVMKHVNMIDYMKSIKRFMMASYQKDSLRQYQDPWDGLMAFHEIVSNKLKVNIAHLEIIIHSARKRAIEELDETGKASVYVPYEDKVPTGNEVSVFTPYNDHMKRRSLGALFAYERQSPLIYDILSYNIKDRHSHPLDEMVRS